MTEQCNRTLVRTWRLIALLRAGAGASLEKLAHDLAVTTRTIRRDLEALQLAGVPLYTVNCDDGVVRWRMVKGTPCQICGRAPFKSADLRRELREEPKGVTA